MLFSKLSRCFGKNFSTYLKSKPTSNNLLKEKLQNLKINQLNDWHQVRHEILTTNTKQHINKTNLDAQTISVCASLKKYNLARNYMEFLNNQQIPINLATYGKYLRLFQMKHRNGDEITSEDQREILDISNKIFGLYSMLDPNTIENLIGALALTQNWRQTIDLLRNENLVSGPTTTCYNAVISAAFRHNDPQLAWQLLTEMLENNKQPDNIVYSAYFERLQQFPDARGTIREDIEKLLEFLQENNLTFDEIAAKQFKNFLTKQKIKTSPVRLMNNNCMNCKNALQRFDLTDKEFNELKSRILDHVIIGSNVFNKTTPNELDRFDKFIKTLQPHNVIIDGLNVAYSTGARKTPQILVNVVIAVVKYFVQRKQSILLLGREHMNKWPNWNFIEKHTTTFLTENLSQDDPFLLYSALHCGKNTIVVTKDLMRSHRFLLKDLHSQNLFNRWLKQRQYQLVRVNGHDGRPIFKLPPKFTSVPQKSGQFWHVPYERPCGYDGKDQEIAWFCFKFL